MIHKVLIKELTPGMHVVDVGVDPREFPHVFAKEGLITSEEDVAAALRQGYREAFVDDVKSLVPVNVTSMWSDLFASSVQTSAETDTELDQHVRESLSQAVATYSSSIKSVKNIFASLLSGETLPLDSVYQTVGQVVKSITSKAPVFAAVAKLQNLDDYTFVHCVNVSVMAAMFANHLELDPEIVYQAALAGLLHDIGKTQVPSEILFAARCLTDDEFVIMRKHAEYGYDMLKATHGLPKNVMLGIREHHERFDGTGYPDRKSDANISPLGRILSIVDVYDALSSKRVYKSAITPHTSVSFLYSQRGEAFTPSLVERFIQCVGIYPAGSIVRLSTGEIGVVYYNTPNMPLLPVVGVVLTADEKRRPLKIINLSTKSGIKIESGLDPHKLPMPIEHVLAACQMIAPRLRA